MSNIDPTARVASGAKIGRDVFIGPYCVVGPDVTLADNVRLIAQVHIQGHTAIGARSVVYPFTSLGSPPQSVKYRGGPTRLVIGEDCQIRENVTMSIGTEGDQGVTEIGDRCFIMVGVHIGHDCRIHNDVTMANNTILGGHVVVENHVIFGGQTAVHQFVRIGEYAMIAGATGVNMDIIPFGMAIGQRARIDGLNIVGLKRRGLSRADIHRLRLAYNALFLAEGRFDERIAAVRREYGADENVVKILDFIHLKRLRPLTPARVKSESRAAEGAHDSE